MGAYDYQTPYLYHHDLATIHEGSLGSLGSLGLLGSTGSITSGGHSHPDRHRNKRHDRRGRHQPKQLDAAAMHQAMPRTYQGHRQQHLQQSGRSKAELVYGSELYNCEQSGYETAAPSSSHIRGSKKFPASSHGRYRNQDDVTKSRKCSSDKSIGNNRQHQIYNTQQCGGDTRICMNGLDTAQGTGNNSMPKTTGITDDPGDRKQCAASTGSSGVFFVSKGSKGSKGNELMYISPKSLILGGIGCLILFMFLAAMVYVIVKSV